MKHYLYGLLLLFSSQLFVTIYASSHNTDQNNADIKNSQQTLLVFGDSLSSAYNMPVDKGWVNLLQGFTQKKGYSLTITNASISGETTENGLRRLETLLKQHQPDILLIELGGNDGLRGFNLKMVKDNIQAMITLSQNYGADVLLAGIQIPPNYGRTYTEKFSAIFAELAKVNKTALIPFILEKVALESSYMQADGIHPNQAAQPIIMQTVWTYLEPMLIKSNQS
jgi:acyl-CoA thioesterase-1